MQITGLSDTEILLLEALDALGGNAHISELKGAVRWQARANAHRALGVLDENGLLTRYARGCYTLTPSGRELLRSLREERDADPRLAGTDLPDDKLGAA